MSLNKLELRFEIEAMKAAVARMFLDHTGVVQEEVNAAMQHLLDDDTFRSIVQVEAEKALRSAVAEAFKSWEVQEVLRTKLVEAIEGRKA